MAVVFKNNAKTTLSAGITSSATSITVTDGSVFPSLSGGDVFFLTLDDLTNNEIVKCTAISGNTLTVVRAQEGTTARAFSANNQAELRITAGILGLFSQTDAVITDEIEAYLDANGLTFPDNVKGQFGSSNDLQIYHDGSDSIIHDNGTGNLKIRATNLRILNAAGTQNFISHNDGGDVKLYYAGNQKLATTSTGIDVTGNITTSSSTPTHTLQDSDGTNQLSTLAQDGGSFILTARNNTSNGNIIFKGNNGSSVSEYARFNSSGNFSTQGNITVGGNLTVNGTTTTLNTATLDVEDKNITLNYSTGDSSASANGAGITIQDAVNSTTDATILWEAIDNRFDFSNHIGLPDDKRIKLGDNQDLQIFHNSTNNHSVITESGSGDLRLSADDLYIKNAAATENKAVFLSDGAVKLYYNDAEKIKTTSTGIDVTGTAVVDGLTSSGIATVDELSVTNDATFNGSIDVGGGTIDCGAITSIGNSRFNGDFQVGDTLNQNAFGALQVNQTSNVDEEGIAVLAAAGGRSIRIWVDETNSYINSGNGGSGNLIFNEAITVSSGGNLTGVGTINSGAITSSGNINTTAGEFKINGVTVINASRQLRNIEAIRIQSTEIMDNTRLLKNITGIELTGDNRQIKFLGDGGPYGLEFGDTEANPNFRLYYRTSPNTLTFENNASSAKHTFDLSGNYTSTGDITSGDDVIVGDLLIMAGGNTKAIAFTGTGSDTNVRHFAYEESGHHYVTNRHTDGDLILKSNNGTGGGELARMTLQAGSGTQEIDITNANLDLNSNNITGVGTISSGAITTTNVMASSPYHHHFDVSGTNVVGGGAGIVLQTSASAGTTGLYGAKIQAVRTASNDGSADLQFYTSDADTASGAHQLALTLDENQNATFAGNITATTGDIQAGSSGNSAFLRAYYGTSYMTLQGYGLEMNRTTSYIRPTTDGNKTLYIGGVDASLDWAAIHFRSLNGLYMTGTRFLTTTRDLENIGTISSGAITSSGAMTINEGNAFTDLNIKSDRTSGNIGGVNFVNASNVIKGQIFGNTDGTVYFYSGGQTEALRLTNSQNAVFAGDVNSDGDVNLDGKLSIEHDGSNTGDVLSLFNNRFNQTTMYGFGLASGTLYYKANTRHQFYNGSNYDNSSFAMELDDNRLRLAVPLSMGTTTVIDTSRNLTNIGTISSGAITSSGLVTADELTVTNDSTFNGSIDATGQTITSGAITAVNSGNVLTVGDGTRAFRVFTDSDEVSLLADGSVAMKFYTSGAEKMRIDTSGRVGIGTASPAAKLHVAGDIRLSDNFIDFKSGGNAVNPQFKGKREDTTSLSSRAFTDEGGFSYTTFADEASDAPTGATNNANGLITMNTHGGAYVHQLAMTSSGNMYHRYNNGGSLSSWSKIHKGGALTDVTSLTMSGDLAVNTNNLFVDVSAAKVGIGTSSPSRKLTVQGGSGDNLPVRIIGGASTTQSALEFQDPSTTADYKVTLGSKGDDLFFQAGGSERARIDSSGNLIIGNTSAGAKLDIRQDSGYAIRAENGSGHYFRVAATGQVEITNNAVDGTASLLLNCTENSQNASPILEFNRDSASPADADYLGQIKFTGENDNDQSVLYSKITGKISDASDTTEDGIIEFMTKKAGANNISMRLGPQSLQLINGTGLTVAGDATITGDLTVNGTTTTLNTATLDVEDKNITLNYSSSDSSGSANGAGITIQDAVSAGNDATILWDASSDRFDFSHPIEVGTLDVDVITNASGVVHLNDTLYLQDNSKAVFGDSSDLQIYHDGSHSRIDDTGTGKLILRGSTDVEIHKYTGEYMITANADGAVKLYHDDSVRLTTQAAGIKVNSAQVGGINAPTLNIGQLNNAYQSGIESSVHLTMKTYNPSGNFYFYRQNTIQASIIDGNFGIGQTTVIDSSRNLLNLESISMPDSKKIKLGAGDDLQLFHNGSSSVIRNDTGHLDIKNGSNDADIRFMCDDGSGGEVTYMTIDGSHSRISVAKEFIALDNVPLRVGSGGDAEFKHDGSNTYLINKVGDFYIQNTADDKDIVFQSDNGAGGVQTYFSLDGSAEQVVFEKSARFTDNDKAIFGTGSDLEIYHDGSHSYIEDAGTGNLYIRGDNTIDIRRQVNGEQYITAVANGAVTLFYDGSSKLATTSTGIDVTGGADAIAKITGTSTAARLDLATTTHHVFMQVIESDGRFRIYDQTAANEYLTISNAGLVGIGTNSPDTKLDVTANGVQGILLNQDTSNGAVSSRLFFKDQTRTNAIVNVNGNLELRTGATIGVSSGTQRLVINGSSGNVGIGTSSPAQKLDVAGIIQSTSSNPQVRINTSSGTGAGYLVFGDSADDDRGWISYLHASDDMQFRVNASVALTLDSSQNATFAGDILLADSKILKLGTGLDLQIYHNGTDSFINNDTGTLFIKQFANDGDIKILSDDGSGNTTEYIRCDGGLGQVKLFHYGSEKFITTSAGIKVTGEVNLTGELEINGTDVIDSSRNLLNINNINLTSELNFTGNGNKYIDVETLALSNALTIRHHNPSGNLFETAMIMYANGGTIINYDGSGRLSTTSAGASITGSLNITSAITHTTHGTILDSSANLTNINNVYASGYRIGSTQIVDSSRNLTNINSLSVAGYIYHTGDTDTNIQFATDQIKLNTGGSLRFQATNSGATVLGVPLNISAPNSAEIKFNQTTGSTTASKGSIQWFDSGSNSCGTINLKANGAENNSGVMEFYVTAETDELGDDPFGINKMMTITENGVTVHGSLSKSSGSFRIDHPLKPETHDLVHSFVESPQADNLYRGVIKLENGRATVDLDEWFDMTAGTFLALNRDIQAFVNNSETWDAVRAKVMGSQLVIECQNLESNAEVSWLVIGERQDKEIHESALTNDNGKIIVEPEKVG